MKMINIKKVNDKAIIPSYFSKGSSGFDFHSCENVVIHSGEYKLVKTGLVFELEENMELQVRSRSGLAYKHGVAVLNSPGTVDSDYRGEVGIILINHGTQPFEIQVGDRIAQGVIVENVKQYGFKRVGEVSETMRGEGGFGSTGIKDVTLPETSNLDSFFKDTTHDDVSKPIHQLINYIDSHSGIVYGSACGGVYIYSTYPFEEVELSSSDATITTTLSNLAYDNVYRLYLQDGVIYVDVLVADGDIVGTKRFSVLSVMDVVTKPNDKGNFCNIFKVELDDCISPTENDFNTLDVKHIYYLVIPKEYYNIEVKEY